MQDNTPPPMDFADSFFPKPRGGLPTNMMTLIISTRRADNDLDNLDRPCCVAVIYCAGSTRYRSNPEKLCYYRSYIYINIYIIYILYIYI